MSAVFPMFLVIAVSPLFPVNTVFPVIAVFPVNAVIPVFPVNAVIPVFPVNVYSYGDLELLKYARELHISIPRVTQGMFCINQPHE